jgi:lipoprotein-anchoring transpeptidase ErfK/SrfK
MKNPNQWLRLWVTFLVSATVSLTTWGWLTSTPVLANSQPEAIAQTMNSLKDEGKHWIEIDLTNQYLTAWEGKQEAYTTIISSGKPTTPTHPGVFNIQSKHPTDRMRGADYDIPNVPYVMYYYRGYALHGANWHDNFGTPVSHGCINLPVDSAQWLFNWVSVGIPIVIH